MIATVPRADQKRWSYQDYLRLDDDLRYEIIRGELLLAPAPNPYHQQASRNLGFALWQFVKDNELGEVLYAPVDVILDEHNVVQPDIVFVANAKRRIIQKRGLMGAPDLVAEILSPSTLQRDRLTKKDLYEKFGVTEYWLVDAANGSLEVFVLRKGKYHPLAFAAESGKVKSKVIAGFELDAADVMP